MRNLGIFTTLLILVASVAFTSCSDKKIEKKKEIKKEEKILEKKKEVKKVKKVKKKEKKLK